MSAHLHFAENTFTLHLLLESAKRLVNIVVADEYLHGRSCYMGSIKGLAHGQCFRSTLNAANGGGCYQNQDELSIDFGRESSWSASRLSVDDIMTILRSQWNPSPAKSSASNFRNATNALFGRLADLMIRFMIDSGKLALLHDVGAARRSGNRRRKQSSPCFRFR